MIAFRFKHVLINFLHNISMWTSSREINGKLQFLRNEKKHYESIVKEDLIERFSCFLQSKLQFVNPDGIEIPPYVCQYSRDFNENQICLIADEEGFVSLVDSGLNSPRNNIVKVSEKWRCHKNAIFDVAWGSKGTFATASGDTTSVLWDANSPEKHLNILRGHSCSLKSVDISKHKPNLIATGSRDGNALIWDSRCKHNSIPPVIRIQDAHAIHDALTPQKKRRKKISMEPNNQLLHDSRQTVTSVLFQDGLTLVTSGAMDGTLKLWDLRMIQSVTTGRLGNQPKPKESIRYPGCSNRRRGYTCLAMDSTHSTLFASCTDDTIYQYNLSNCAKNETRIPVRRYTGHFSSSFYVKISLSPDDMFLLSGCDYEKAYIWNTCSSKQIVSPHAYLACDSLEQVTSVDWCPHDWTKIVTCSDDCTARFWLLSEEWPRTFEHRGVCEILHPTPQTLSGKKKSVWEGCMITPVKSVLKQPLDQMSPSFVEKYVDRPSPKQKQLSLSKWMTKSDCSIWSFNEGDDQRRFGSRSLLLREGPTNTSLKSISDAEINKENNSSPRSFIKPSSRKVLGSSNTPSPIKIEFKSQKAKKKNNENAKQFRTMEDFFL